MSRRQELEKELEIAQKRVNNAPSDTPQQVIDDWQTELDSISFELDNLYDDDQDDDN